MSHEGFFFLYIEVDVHNMASIPKNKNVSIFRCASYARIYITFELQFIYSKNL